MSKRKGLKISIVDWGRFSVVKYKQDRIVVAVGVSGAERSGHDLLDMLEGQGFDFFE